MFHFNRKESKIALPIEISENPDPTAIRVLKN